MEGPQDWGSCSAGHGYGTNAEMEADMRRARAWEKKHGRIPSSRLLTVDEITKSTIEVLRAALAASKGSE